METRNYFRFVLSLCLLPMLLLNASASQAASLSCGKWNVVASPNVGSSDELKGVAAVSATDIWAVGYSGTPSNTQTLIEHWNGKKWSVVSSPNPSSQYNQFYGVAAVTATAGLVSASNVWAVGYSGTSQYTQTLIEHWNGKKWSVVPGPNPSSQYNQFYGVTAVSASDVWAVGYYNNSNGSTQTLIEHWNGSRWSIVPSPNPGSANNFLFGVAAISASDVWAVGYYLKNTNHRYQMLIEHWNGKNWSIVPSPNIGLYQNFLEGVAAVSATDIWAVGIYADYGGFNPRTLSEHWNGTKWSIVKMPTVGQNLQKIDLPSVAAVSASDVWAVGEYFTNNSVLQALIEHWNGTKWSIVPSPNVGTGNLLSGVAAVTATDLWTVGYYTNSNNIEQTLTEHYC